MKKIIVFVLVIYINLFATYSINAPLLWSLYSVKTPITDISTLSNDATLILSYKNSKWYGVSPNGKFSEEDLSYKDISKLNSLETNDAIWVFFESSNRIINFNSNIPDNCEEKISLKSGWNLMSLNCNKSVFIKSYFTNEDIESIWAYDNYSKSWRIFSFDVNSDENLEFFDTLNSYDGYWVLAKKDFEIYITNKEPFFDENDYIYNLSEDEMKSFSIKFKDPNGDALSVNIDNIEDFEINQYNNIIFKSPVNYKPKQKYSLSVTISDGVYTISKNITINIDLFVENNYEGEYKQIGKIDPRLNEQWHLQQDYLNILKVHENYDGSSENGSTVQIVEGGFYANHNDLIANIDFSMANDLFLNNNVDKSRLNHGTAVAGIIGARGDNGEGIKGIVPFGKITAYMFNQREDGRLLLGSEDLKQAWLNTRRANEITVSSNSWTNCIENATFYDDLLKQGSDTLRDGKGRIYVFASGNFRNENDYCPNASTNLQTMLNNPYSIVVSGITKEDKIYDLSTKGANILVSAYGSNNDILSTSSTIYNYANFGGTSAAAPMVSGGIALLLEACPSLTYRDVQYILAKTATKIDLSNNSWIKNGANLLYSTDYGFGKLNVYDAINMCKNNYKLLDLKKEFEKVYDFSVQIDEIQVLNMDVSESFKATWVGIYLDGKIDDIGKYQFILQSPKGTQIELIHGNNAAKDLDIDTTKNVGFYLGEYSKTEIFRLSSVGFLDEDIEGNWKILIKGYDIDNQNNSLLKKVKLQIIGY